MKTISIRLVIVFLSALILTILPLPTLVMVVRPPWVLLLILYLQFYLTTYFNVTTIFLLGLVLDGLLATVLGEHTLALSLVVWMAHNKSRRFYLLSMTRQMLLIGFFCFVYQLILILIDAFLGFHSGFIHLLGSSIAGMLLWPWIRLIGEDILSVKATYF